MAFNNFIEYLEKSYQNRDIILPNTQLPQIQSLNIYNLVQDGLFILNKCDENIVENLKKKSLVEYVIIADYIIGRRTHRNIAWFDQETSQITFSTDPDLIYRRLLPEHFTPIKYETIDHTNVIKNIILSFSNCHDFTYLEFGVRDSITLNTIAPFIKTAIGVDINPFPIKHNNITPFIMTTDNFSNGNLKSYKIDIAFIDADHSSKSAYQDFQNILPHMNDGGLIFLHDTYPCESHFLDEKACHDCYKTPLLIKQIFPHLNILTIPLNPGLTIVEVT
jgi:hypothetical protein